MYKQKLGCNHIFFFRLNLNLSDIKYKTKISLHKIALIISIACFFAYKKKYILKKLFRSIVFYLLRICGYEKNMFSFKYNKKRFSKCSIDWNGKN